MMLSPAAKYSHPLLKTLCYAPSTLYCVGRVCTLRYKIRLIGISLSGPTYIYGNNKSQVTNSYRPESTLKKKCNSICYHAIHELVARGETLLTHIRTGENLEDFLTKTTSGAERCKLVSGVVHDICDDFPKQ
jgi:hypothetical protein